MFIGPPFSSGGAAGGNDAARPVVVDVARFGVNNQQQCLQAWHRPADAAPSGAVRMRVGLADGQGIVQGAGGEFEADAMLGEVAGGFGGGHAGSLAGQSPDHDVT